MDNISHTLVGALLGAYLARTRRAEDSSFDEATRHKLFVPIMAVGSNLPDIDLIYTSIYSGKLEYMLHHRGHTHTILGALLLSLLLWLFCRWWLARRQISLQGGERKLLMFVCVFGPLLHILMDATNSYGVHPFWPFDNRWYYFDTIFIVEPLFWAAAAPLVFVLRTLVGRVLVGLILIAGVGLAFFTKMVPMALCVALAAIMGLLAWAGWRLQPRLALFVGIVFWLGTTLWFSNANVDAARTVRAIVADQLPHTTLMDHVLTPMPVNPACWEVMLVQTQGTAYAVRRAVVSVQPSLITASECPNRMLDGGATAPLEAVELPNSSEIKWHGEALFSLADLRRLYDSRCEVRALMQFVRAPWWVEASDGWIVGDLRYDREAELGFAEVQLGPQERCPQRIPPWVPPRQDVLDLRRTPADPG